METKVTIPQMGESVVECTLTKWLKKIGDRIALEEPLFEISSDKVDSEIPSPAAGILSEILVHEGETVKINAVAAIIADSADDGRIASQEPVSLIPQGSTNPFSDAVEKTEMPSILFAEQRTSPLVRKIAREENVNLSELSGSGLEGRITKEDILAYIAKRAASGGQTAVMDPLISTKPQEENAPIGPRFFGETETVAMTPMRKAIASHMVLSRKVSAHVNTVFEVDVSSIVRLHHELKEVFKNRDGIPLTYTPFFAKALIDTVREFPIFNASVSEDSIIFKKPINLGIAVAMDSGLIVPVIRDAHLKNFSGIALAIHDLAERARTKRLKPDDVQNGTITLTNPGIYGPLFETPIINQPQVAILSVGGISKRPVVINDAIAIRSIVYLSLAFDHRIIDGAVADQFMSSLKEKLQNWTQTSDL
jgi:2-oxoglutarate dehydrogenase E2 component (dihydrolipoamide succinyltransferase)